MSQAVESPWSSNQGEQPEEGMSRAGASAPSLCRHALLFCSKQQSRRMRLCICMAVVKPQGTDKEETAGNQLPFAWFLLPREGFCAWGEIRWTGEGSGCKVSGMGCGWSWREGNWCSWRPLEKVGLQQVLPQTRHRCWRGGDFGLLSIKNCMFSMEGGL